MSQRKPPELDMLGASAAILALLVLLYFGLASKSFSQTYWVAFAFWIVGFIGSYVLGFFKPSPRLSLNTLIGVFVGTGLIIAAFTGLNVAYAQMKPQDLYLTDRLLSFSIGVCEELFFGIFLIGMLTTLIRLPNMVAIIASSGVHTVYHVPAWGTNPMTLSLFFVSFLIARAVYVYFMPKVGVLLAAHGLWNFAVTGGT